MKVFDNLASAVVMLCHEQAAGRAQRKLEFEWFKSHLKLATKEDLEKATRQIMATQAEVTAKLNVANTRLEKLITDTATYQGTVDELKKQIVELQRLIDAGGTIGPELVEAANRTEQLAQQVDDNVPEVAPA